MDTAIEESQPNNDSHETVLSPYQKLNYKFVAIIIFCLLFGGIVGYYVGINKYKNNPQLSNNSVTPSISSNYSPTNSMIQITSTVNPTNTPIPSEFYPTETPITIQPVSQWKTYTSDDGKFSMKYPTNFVLRANQAVAGFTDSSASKFTYKASPGTILLDVDDSGVAQFMRIKYEKLTASTTLEAYIEKNSTCTDVTPNGGSTLLVDGINTKLFETGCGQAGETDVYFLNGNIAYTIIMNGSNYDTNFLKSFLSNIKFL